MMDEFTLPEGRDWSLLLCTTGSLPGAGALWHQVNSELMNGLICLDVNI